MNTLKFRAWDRDHKHFVYFDFSDLESMNVMFGNDGLTEYCDFNGMYQQITGLTDKNGKEIYEGDIVKTVYGNEIYKVEYHQSTFMYIGKERNQYPNHNLSSNSEVIGNIYENPDLL